VPPAFPAPLAFLFLEWWTAAAVAGGAVAVPVIIHLLNRRRYRVVRWAAMRFLLSAQKQSSRKLRIEQLLLLAVRCLILLLLALAMASVTPWAEAAWRWVAPNGVAAPGATARTHKVLVLDGSLGMNRRRGGDSDFDEARDLARQVVREGGGGDGYSVILLAGPPRLVVPGGEPGEDAVGLPSEAPDKVVERLDSLRPTHGNAELAAAVGMVEDVLKASPSKYVEKEVYFFTNLQKTTWAARQPAALAAALQQLQTQSRTILVDVGENGVNNLAVEGLSLGGPVAVAGRQTPIQATLHNYGEARKDVAVSLMVGKADSAADWEKNLQTVGETTVAAVGRDERPFAAFTYSFPDPGEYVVRVKVTRSSDKDGNPVEEALTVDDVRQAVVAVKKSVPVLLVNGKPAPEAFDRATEFTAVSLNPYKNGDPPPGANVLARPKVISDRDFTDEGLGDLSPYDCVFLCDVPLFTKQEAKRLLNHVRRGGGVVIALGERASLQDYNDTLGPAGAGLLPARLVGPQAGNAGYAYQLQPDPDAERDAPLAAFRDPRPREMLLSARFHKFVLAEPAERGAARRLLSFAPVAVRGGDGAATAAPPPGGPALVEWRPPAGKDSGGRARGRVVLVTTTLNADWNAWPASPSFPPFVNHLMNFAASGRLREQAVEVGDPLELYVDSAAGGADAVVHTPDGPRTARTQNLDDGSVLRWAETDLSGVYGLAPAGGGARLFAVNPPAVADAQQGSPSDLARVSSEDLKTTYPDWDFQLVTELRQVIHAEAHGVVGGDVEPIGPYVAHAVLLLVLVLFLAEVVLAWLFGHYSSVQPLESEAVRPPTRGRWALTMLPWYVAAGLCFAVLLALGYVLIDYAVTGDFLGFLPDGARGWMEWWQNVTPPAEGEGRRWGLKASHYLWSDGADPWLASALFAAAAALVALIYFREGRGVRAPYRSLLAGLRLAGLLLLMGVFLPQLHVAYERQGWPDVAVIIDDSYSMSTVDKYRTEDVRKVADALAEHENLSRADRIHLAQALVARSDPDRPDWLTTMVAKRKVRVHVYHCSAKARQLATVSSAEEVGPALDAVHKLNADPANDSSQLGAAVRQVLGEFSGSSLAAVVVLTDGVTTEGETLEHVAEHPGDSGKAAGGAADARVPLFFVGVGDAAEARDLRLHDLQAVDSVYANDRVIFSFSLTMQGYDGLTVPVTLKEKGKNVVLDRKNVTLKSSGDEVKVQLEHKPSEPGEKTYVVEVPAQAGESDTDNNKIEHKVLVREAKLIHVLYVEGYRRYEYHFLKTLLERESNRTKGNKSIDLKVVLVGADPDFAVQDRSALADIPSREELKAYDVILLGDVDPHPPGGGKMTEHLKDMAEWVKEHGGGLLMIAGERYAPAAYKDSPLKDVLPIDITSDKPADDGGADRTETYRPELTPEGRRHPSFRFSAEEGEDEAVWKRLKEMYWWADGYVPKRAAEVLAVHPKAKGPAVKGEDRAGGPERQALVVQQFVGAGRTMFLGFDETWRWGFREDQAEYNRFWIQTVRYLSGSRSDRVELRLDRQAPYRRGDKIKVTVRFPDDAPPPAAETVQVQLERRRPDRPAEAAKQTLELPRVQGSRATYGTALTQTPEGLYTFTLTDPVPPGPRPSAECKVLPPPGEMDQLRMNQAEMERAADSSHGKFYTLATADKLLDDLPVDKRVPLKAAPSDTWTLWNWLYPLALLLLTTEWVLRKQKNLV
jgi:hypothetical protein